MKRIDAAANSAVAMDDKTSAGICLFCCEPIDGKHESDCPQADAQPLEQMRAGWPWLAELHADAAYLFHRVQQGTLSPDDAAKSVREKIDAAQASLTDPLPIAQPVEDTLTDEKILEIASEYQTVVPGNCLYIVEFARAILDASKSSDTSGDATTPALQAELEILLNKHSRENESNTPDFILAQFMLRCLEAFEKASKSREAWYGNSLSI